jgi:hypothetical protein
MRKFIVFLAVSLLFIACSKDDTIGNLDGTYSGTFTRTDPSGGNTPTANVNLEFTEDGFTGRSDMANYPAICSGSYTLEGNKIKPLNKCVFPANFDWSFIFNGEYNYEFDGTNLKIWKEYNSGSKDIYLLKRKD